MFVSNAVGLTVTEGSVVGIVLCTVTVGELVGDEEVLLVGGDVVLLLGKEDGD